MTDIRELVAEQADDEGLWFIAQTAPEAYLQAALRRLHALIERDQTSQCDHVYPDDGDPRCIHCNEPVDSRQSSEFSEFIRNASPERQAEVFGRVLDKASAEQRDAVADGQCQHPVHSNPGLVVPCPECGADA